MGTGLKDLSAKADYPCKFMSIGGEYMTRAQINRIKKIISDHMEVLMQIVIGEGKPSQELLRKLKLPKEITDMINDFLSVW